MTLTERLQAFVPSSEQEAVDRALMLRYLREFPDVLTRDNPLCHFTASGWIVNESRTRVLMCYHNIYRSWSWTGGHADGDPDLLAVALREATEETGVTHIRPVSPDVYSLEIVTVDGHVKRGKYVASHLHLNVTFLLAASEADRLTVKADENSGVLWMTTEEAVERSTEACMRPIYQKLNEKLALFPPCAPGR